MAIRKSSASAGNRRFALILGALMASTTTAAALPAPGGDSLDVELPFTPVASVYAEDFELGANGWTSGGVLSTWTLGAPTAGPAAPFSGVNAWGTNLAGNYNNNECSWIQSPAITLPGAGTAAANGTVSAARLSFKQWLVTENRYDGGVVQVSTDGESWSLVSPAGGYPVALLTSARRCVLGDPSPTPPPQNGWSGTMSTNASAWDDAAVDLSAYLGQTIYVRLVFGSDSSVVKAGWYVDDVLVQVGAGAFASVQPPAVTGPDVPFVGITNVYAEDFELGDGGWTASGAISSWAFGTPTFGPSGPYSGLNAWGTNLAGNYAASECSALVSPAITLPAAGAQLPDGVTVSVAQLAFKQWFNAESRYDGGLVQASNDGGATWTTIAMDTYTLTANTAARACLGLATSDLFQSGTLSTKPDEWLDAGADLTPFLGQTIQVRFAFASDSSVHRAGWYVDDIIVSVGAGASADVPLPDVANASVEAPFVEALTAYEEGFEDGLGGWTPVQNKVDTRQYLTTFAHGVPTLAAGPAPVSGNVWGTNLGGNYANNECGAVTSPTISVPGSASVVLSWRQWVRTESAYDGAVLEASSDGGATWNVVDPVGGYPRALNTAARQCIHGVYSSTPPTQSGWSGVLSSNSSAWLSASADLTGYAGQDVSVRFRYASDGSVASTPGFYFDNVTLSVDGTPTLVYDFESDAQGWSAASTPIPKPLSWEAGAPANVGPTSAASGAGVLATNVDGDFADGECSSVESGPIDLTGQPAQLTARLTMSQWFSTTEDFDGGLVQMRTDGGDWTVLTPAGGYPSNIFSSVYQCAGVPSSQDGFAGALNADPAEWSAMTYNLTNASGHVVELRLVFGADTSTTAPGWYVDDVRIALGVGGSALGVPEAPEAPASAAAVALDERLLEALAGGGDHGSDKTLDVVVGGPAMDAPATTDRVGVLADYHAQSDAWLASVAEYAAKHGGEVNAAFAAAPAIVVTLPRDAVAGLAGVEGVERVTLDDEKSVHLIAPVPNDDVDAANNDSVPMTQAPDIWALGYRGEGVKVAIIDTGIDGTHEITKDAACNSRIVGWKDWVNDQPAPYDDQGHGTHVTGTSVGSTACGGRANGVAPKADIMGVKFLNSGGSGSFANAMNALQWSFDNGADITSNSWGGSCSASIDVVRLVNNLARGGMVSAFAAGNSGPSSGTIGGPGCAEYAVTVGSTDKGMVISSFSSRGPCTDTTEGGVSRLCPDVVAVGGNVISSVPRGSCSLCDPSGYDALSGTSMATPHVAGALALMTQFKLALTGVGWDTASKAEETALELTAIDLGATGEDNVYGNGFIQLLPIYNLIANPGVPDVRGLFTAPDGAELRIGASAPLAFRVSNAGTRAVDGTLTVTLTTPDGATVVDQRDVRLDFGGGAGHTMTFTVGANTAAGTYSYAGDFVYSWVDDENVTHTGEIHRSASWTVKKIDVRIVREMPAVVPVGTAFDVVLTIENRGNEDALNLTLEETIRDTYLRLPGDPDPANANWIQGGTPAPTSYRQDTNFGRTTLAWALGDFPSGSSTTLTYSVVATKEGTFPFIGVTKYTDGLNRAFQQGFTTAQTVLPATALLPTV